MGNVEEMGNTGFTASRMSPWSKDAFRMLFMRIREDYHFNICAVDSIIQGVSPAQEAIGLTRAKDIKSPEYGTLHALHCVKYEDMTPSVRAGILPAVLGATGMNTSSGTALFGAADWAEFIESLTSQWEAAEVAPDQPETPLTTDLPNENEPYMTTPKWLLLLVVAFILGASITAQRSQKAPDITDVRSLTHLEGSAFIEDNPAPIAVQAPAPRAE